jgi:hypothetical protein
MRPGRQIFKSGGRIDWGYLVLVDGSVQSLSLWMKMPQSKSWLITQKTFFFIGSPRDIISRALYICVFGADSRTRRP